MQQIPIDDKTYIVEVPDETFQPELRRGTFCIFRREERNVREGALVLVACDPESEQTSYSIKRYKGQKGENCGTPTEPVATGRSELSCDVQASSDQDCIVGEFICTLE